MFKRGCEKCGEFWYIGNDSTCSCPDETLAQPEQEPVAWEKSYDIACALLRQAHDILAATQYPIKRPWVSLTEDESSDIYNAHHNTYGECITSADDLVLDIEAALRSKNDPPSN